MQCWELEIPGFLDVATQPKELRASRHVKVKNWAEANYIENEIFYLQIIVQHSRARLEAVCVRGRRTVGH